MHRTQLMKLPYSYHLIRSLFYETIETAPSQLKWAVTSSMYLTKYILIAQRN